MKMSFITTFLLASNALYAQVNCDQYIIDEVTPDVSMIRELDKKLKPRKVDNFIVEDSNKNHWILTFRFGPSFNWFSRTDYLYKDKNLDATFHKIKLKQRPSMAFYKVWKADQNPAQFIDEPANQFVIEFEKNHKWAAGIRASHSKTVTTSYGSVDTSGDYNENQDIKVTGTIDGEVIDGNYNLHDYFHNIEISKLFYQVEIYAQRLFPVVNTKNSRVNFKLGAAMGLYVGTSLNVNNFLGKYIKNQESSFSTMGKNVSVKTGIEYRFKDRISIGVDYQLTAGQLKYDTGEGQAEIPFLLNQNLSVNVGVTLIKSKNSKKKKLDY